MRRRTETKDVDLLKVNPGNSYYLSSLAQPCRMQLCFELSWSSSCPLKQQTLQPRAHRFLKPVQWYLIFLSARNLLYRDDEVNANLLSTTIPSPCATLCCTTMAHPPSTNNFQIRRYSLLCVVFLFLALLAMVFTCVDGCHDQFTTPTSLDRHKKTCKYVRSQRQALQQVRWWDGH